MGASRRRVRRRRGERSLRVVRGRRALSRSINAYAPRLVSLKRSEGAEGRSGRASEGAPAEVRDAVASNFALAAKARDAMGGVPRCQTGGAGTTSRLDARVVAGHLLFLCARPDAIPRGRGGDRRAASLAMDQTGVRGMEPAGDGRRRRRNRATISRVSGRRQAEAGRDARHRQRAQSHLARTRRARGEATRHRRGDARGGARLRMDRARTIRRRVLRHPHRANRAAAAAVVGFSAFDAAAIAAQAIARRATTPRVPRPSSPRGGGDETQGGVQGLDGAFSIT